MTILNKDLKQRILDISYKYGLSHIGSNVTAVDIIDEMYKAKRPHDQVVLSAGHAGLSLYTVIEKFEGINAEKLYTHHGTHPDRCHSCHIPVSAGSLGHGLGIAVGLAIASPQKRIYCLISDGECAEGSIWESLRLMEEYQIDNLYVYININGYGAYSRISKTLLLKQIHGFVENMRNIYIRITDTNAFPFLKGLDAHYYKMTEKDYKVAVEILKKYD